MITRLQTTLEKGRVKHEAQHDKGHAPTPTAVPVQSGPATRDCAPSHGNNENPLVLEAKPVLKELEHLLALAEKDQDVP